MMVYIMFNPQTLSAYTTRELPTSRRHSKLENTRRVGDVCIDVADARVGQRVADQWANELVFGKPMKAARSNIIDIDEDVLNKMLAAREAYTYNTYPELFI